MFSEISSYLFRSSYKSVGHTTSSADLSAIRSGHSPDAVGAKGSPNESFAKVALKARALLDAAYGRLGKVADTRTTGTEWRADIKIGQLDRRALYAIKSNHGGLFSNAEVSAATLPVEDLLKKAAGAADPQGKNPAAAFKASIGVLDGASSEEKASLSWIKARAEAQWSYESQMRDRYPGRTPANVETHNPVVNLFVKAWGEFSARSYGVTSVEDTPSGSKALSLWSIQNSRYTGSKTIGYL